MASSSEGAIRMSHDVAPACRGEFAAHMRAPFARRFAKIAGMLAELLDIAQFEFTAKGLRLVSVDSAHIFLIDLTLIADEWFDRFEGFRGISGDDEAGIDTTDNEELGGSVGSRSITVVLNTAALKRALRDVGDKSNLLLQCEGEDATDYIYATISHPDTLPARTTVFQLPQLLTDQHNRIEIPDRVYDCEFMLAASVLTEVCTALKGTTENITIDVDPTRVIFRVETPVRAEAKLVAQDAVPIVCRVPCAPSFKFKFFETLSKAAKIHNAGQVLVQLGKASPLSMCYTFGDGESSLNFFLAPVMEDADV